MLAPRPYGLLASRALAHLNPQGNLKTIYAFQAAFFAAAGKGFRGNDLALLVGLVFWRRAVAAPLRFQAAYAYSH